jgi:myo-inositol 2-dehydrogenase/D-chiro-inositol 1-dehydrogenase
MKKVRVGLVGSGFVSTIHAESLKRVPAAEVVAVMSPSGDHAEKFARKFGIAKSFKDFKKFIELEEMDVIVLGAPNHLHCPYTEEAAKAGKHVICEKPLARNLQEADRMIAACKKAGVKLMYAEELCFTPKYVRLKRLVDEGAIGRPYLVKQAEKHDGPHSEWFWDVEKSGGGVTLDMGCHAFEYFRWLLGKPSGRRTRMSAPPGMSAPAGKKGGKSGEQTQSHETPVGEIVPLVKPRATSVYADMGTFVHKDRTKGDDNAIIIVRFDVDGEECVGMAEESWSKKGGMDDTSEVYGTAGVAYADLLQGNAIVTYSDTGYAYAVEKAGTTRGWSYTAWEELWNYGFPQEFEHFIDCVANDKQPLETGEDGRAVLEIILAAYASAGSGRRIELPFEPKVERPIQLMEQGLRRGGVSPPLQRGQGDPAPTQTPAKGRRK